MGNAAASDGDNTVAAAAVAGGDGVGAGDGAGPPHLSLRGISKNFGAVRALRGVDLAVRRGEVTGLVGDNGAGKSTLMKIIAGVERADGGRLALDGAEVAIHSSQAAAAAGIQTVFQDLALCENLDVTANLFLGCEATANWRWLPRLLRPLRGMDMEQDARQAVGKLQVHTLKSVRAKVGLLSGGQRQAVAIARATRTGAESTVVLLDEPTAALGVAQTAQVLDIVRSLRRNRHAVIYVSHNLRDVFSVCDRIAVLRHGAVVGVWNARETTPDEIVAAMTRGGGDGVGDGDGAGDHGDGDGDRHSHSGDGHGNRGDDGDGPGIAVAPATNQPSP